MDRARKEQVVSELKDVFEHSGIIVAAKYAGITVAEMSDLRNKMRENSANVRVAKNRLARIAIEESPPEGMKHLLVDQIVLMYSEDPVTAAKISVEFAKTNENLKIVGGAMGDKILDSNGVTEVSKLPSRQRKVLTLRIVEELRYSEISKIMKMSENSAKVNYHHAVKTIKEKLG